MLNSLGDYELDEYLDQIIQSRIQTFEKFNEHDRTYQGMEISLQNI